MPPAIPAPADGFPPARPARAGHRAGTRGHGLGYLITGVVLTAAVTAVPLLVLTRLPFAAWLWLSSQWASGTFALLVIAVALRRSAG